VPAVRPQMIARPPETIEAIENNYAGTFRKLFEDS
jgi:hypothetical protein